MQIKSQKEKREKEFKIRCYKFTLGVMQLIETLPNKKSYWSLADQLFRAASSIGANVIEAKSSSSRREFINFYQIALKSANETKYWLGLIRDSKTGDSTLAGKLLEEAGELSKILASSIITLKGKK
ncbi:MAG TPA: four helix bundle protein [Bacteroidetes bacterium]|nr:four helix bundle protein [Bacteroidota bacterium]